MLYIYIYNVVKSIIKPFLMVYSTHVILVISGTVSACFNHMSWFPVHRSPDSPIHRSCSTAGCGLNQKSVVNAAMASGSPV